MTVTATDLDYAEYLERYRLALGDGDVGGFHKHQGRLIKKLDRAEFGERFAEYMEMAGHYLDGVERGDTVNDLVVRMIRDLAAQLILTAPV
ncbi:MAG: hypothetical protein R3B06_16485 [Kofleriaceae bacterium]